MHTPDPPYLQRTRSLLAILHLLGVAVIFLPFSHSISPSIYIAQSWAEIDDIVGQWLRSPVEATFWIMLPLPFLIAAALWLLQLRSFNSTASTRHELRVVSALGWLAVLIVGLLHVSFVLTIAEDLRGSSSSSRASLSIVALGVVGVICLAALRSMHRRWRMHRLALAHIMLRGAYIIGVGMPLIGFASDDDLGLGGWLALGMCAFYGIESIIVLVYGFRDPSGTVSSPLLRYWLPRGDADPRPEVPVCFKCGYDLRGTVPAGGTVCPECGTAIAAI